MYLNAGTCSEYSHMFCDITLAHLFKRMYFDNGATASARHQFPSSTHDSDVFVLNCIRFDGAYVST